MRVKSIIIVILVCSILLISFFQIEVKAESKTIVVPDDFSRIQEAINHASEGDTIYVKKGVYHENVGINKSIILMGEDRDFTTIDGIRYEENSFVEFFEDGSVKSGRLAQKFVIIDGIRYNDWSYLFFNEDGTIDTEYTVRY